MRRRIKAAERSDENILADRDAAAVHEIRTVIHKRSRAQLRADAGVIKIHGRQHRHALWDRSTQEFFERLCLLRTPRLCLVEGIAIPFCLQAFLQKLLVEIGIVKFAFELFSRSVISNVLLALHLRS